MSRTMPTPVWIGVATGPRVLIETPDFAKQAALTRILGDQGYSVLACGGPEGTDDRCALVEHHACDGVAGADVVVHAMRPHDSRNREVLLSILQHYTDTPVVVEAPRPYVEANPDDFADCVVVHQPMTSATLVKAVETALATKSTD